MKVRENTNDLLFIIALESLMISIKTVDNQKIKTDIWKNILSILYLWFSSGMLQFLRKLLGYSVLPRLLYSISNTA